MSAIAASWSPASEAQTPRNVQPGPEAGFSSTKREKASRPSVPRPAS